MMEILAGKKIIIGGLLLVLLLLAGNIAVFWYVGQLIAPPLAPNQLNLPSLEQTSAPVTLALNPSAGNLAVGETIKIAVILDSGEKQVIGADVVIKYEPEKIEVIELKPGTIFDHYPFTKINAGKVFVSAVNENGHLFSGQGILTHLIIVPKKPGEAKLRFEFVPGETTDSNVATKENQQDVLEQIKNGVYTFE